MFHAVWAKHLGSSVPNMSNKVSVAEPRETVKKATGWESPGSSVVRTQRFHCRGPTGWSSGQGT